MKPTIGRIVIYKLSELDAVKTNKYVGPGGSHECNSVRVGDEVPLIIARVWPDEFGHGIFGVNGQAILDGNFSLWVTSAKEGDQPGQWHWPEIQKQ